MSGEAAKSILIAAGKGKALKWAEVETSERKTGLSKWSRASRTSQSCQTSPGLLSKLWVLPSCPGQTGAAGGRDGGRVRCGSARVDELGVAIARGRGVRRRGGVPRRSGRLCRWRESRSHPRPLLPPGRNFEGAICSARHCGGSWNAAEQREFALLTAPHPPLPTMKSRGGLQPNSSHYSVLRIQTPGSTHMPGNYRGGSGRYKTTIVESGSMTGRIIAANQKRRAYVAFCFHSSCPLCGFTKRG